jgi:Protein of unknown function DUF262
MSQDFDIAPLVDASVLSLADMRSIILINPEYQREGKIWPLSKKQLFIDTLLNRYDVPKLYFHRLVGSHATAGYGYSIIDGQQRLETIWDFLENKFPLSEDFKFLEDTEIDLKGKYFKEFPSINARIATRLYSRSLAVMVVTTDDLDYIEDMFTRLNDGVPLNAAEKRNSFGGPLPRITRELALHPFFSDRVRVSPSRYRHLDMVGKMLWLAHRVLLLGIIPDTKKTTIDSFFRTGREAPESVYAATKSATIASLDVMAEIFGTKDQLLRSSGTITLYFLLFMSATGDAAEKIVRSDLQQFEELRAENRDIFKNESEQLDSNLKQPDFSLIEYDELTQSSNDAASIAARLKMLHSHFGINTKLSDI